MAYTAASPAIARVMAMSIIEFRIRQSLSDVSSSPSTGELTAFKT